jgi:hypothetical protein
VFGSKLEHFNSAQPNVIGREQGKLAFPHEFSEMSDSGRTEGWIAYLRHDDVRAQDALHHSGGRSRDVGDDRADKIEALGRAGCQ